MELLKIVDNDLSQKELQTFLTNFQVYKMFIRDGLHYALDGVSDTVEIQLKVKQAKADMLTMCYDYVAEFYQENRPHVINIMAGFRKLEAKLQLGKEQRDDEDKGEEERSGKHIKFSSNLAFPDTGSGDQDHQNEEKMKRTLNLKTPLLGDREHTIKTPYEDIGSGFYDKEYYETKEQKKDIYKKRFKKTFNKKVCTVKNFYSFVAGYLPIIQWFPKNYLMGGFGGIFTNFR